MKFSLHWLRRRVITSLCLLVLFYAAGNFWAVQQFVTPKLDQLEKNIVAGELDRLLERLVQETSFLETCLHDWASRDDSYQFAQNRYQAYIDTNLVDASFYDNHLNLIYIFDADGALIWGKVMDLEARVEQKLSPFLMDQFVASHALLKTQGDEMVLSGLCPTGDQVLLLAARPILTSNHQGPIQGTMVFGKILTASLFAAITKRMAATFTWYDLNRLPKGGDKAAVTADLLATGGNRFEVKAEKVHAYRLLRDYQGQAILLLHFEKARRLHHQGQVILNYVFVSNLIFGLFFLVLHIGLYRSEVLHVLHVTQRILKRMPHRVDKIRAQIETSQKMGQLGALEQVLIDLVLDSENRGEVDQQLLIDQRADSLNVTVQALSQEIQERVKVERQLHEIQEGLEVEVQKRTCELNKVNQRLRSEIGVRIKKEKVLEDYQARLRTLSAELLTVEEKERRQIALDLHDQVGQSLSAAAMYLDLAGSVKTPGEAEALSLIQQVKTLVQQSIHDIRTLTFELSPPVLYELGLKEALEWLADQLAERHPLRVQVRCEDVALALSAPFLSFIFRSIRELLLNVVRHAETDMAWVSISQQEDHLYMVVEDQGKGFIADELDRKQTSCQGFGLFSIRERFLSYGGTLTIKTAPGQGVQVVMTTPIQTDKGLV